MPSSPTDVAFYALVTSLASLVVSIISLAVSNWNAWQAHRTSIMPVLVFTRRPSTEWQVENAGNGPAINILFREKDFGGNWKKDITRLYPVAPKTLIPLPRLESAKELVATYEDAYRHKYTSICSEDLTTVVRGNKHPDWKATRSEWRAQQGEPPAAV